MRRVITSFLAGAGAAFVPVAAHAADALKFGPPPAWVHPQAIPVAKSTDAPVELLLDDEQFMLDHDKTVTYNDGAFKIQNAQGLAAGNLSIVWQPATDTVTVNKLVIHRGDQVIDVLKSGQTFTVLRRETNLDAATLDGTLTATIQPEGLQEGDVVELATTTERSDPTLKGHVEAMFAAWGVLPIQTVHAALNWPDDLRLTVRETPNLPEAHRSSNKGMNVLELSGENVEPIVAPRGAPERFQIGRLAEATDFQSWSDVADLMIPLFRDASVIPPSGPLHDEVETIRNSSSDPKVRAAKALALVQDRVRYVALLMGQGGYVPASAEQTWSRRFGDCKAKTALLLAALHSLGIQAEPVLAQVKLGDMLADRLPMISLFNHVLVRAHIGGKDYWLDGTRTGDTDLDSIEIPDFGWALPLVEHAQLVHMIPRPLDVPNVEHVVNIDASPGIYAPAQITIDEIYRGDTAVALNTIYSSASAAQRDQAMHDKANGYFDGFEVSSSSIAFDKSKRELNLTLKGTAKLSWKDGWFYVPTSSIAFDPDFHRQAGPFHDVPLAVGFPSYVKDKATISLPHGFAVAQDLSAPVHETLAGVEYARSETVDGDLVTVDSSERSIAPEVPFKDALTAESRLRALNKDDVYLGVPTGYAPTPKDLAALKETSPGSADDYFVRATAELAAKEVDGATADLTAGLALDPKNASALRKRAGIYFDKHDFAAGEKDLAAAEVIDPDDPLNIKLHGYLAELKDDYEAAVNWYSKALAKNPKDAFSLVHRSRAYDGLGKYDASLSDLNAAVALDPRDGSAYGRRAVVYAMRGDFVAAHKDLDTAIKLSPAAFEVLNARAAIAADEGNDEAAAEAYTAVVNASPKDGWALASRAQAYLSIGEKDKALADTDQALAVGYKTPDVRVIRANIFFQRGDRNAAAKEADAILAENPDSDLAQVSAGKIYAAVGRNDDATKALTRALQLKPAAYIYLNLADVRPVTDYAQRMSDVENALKLEPDSVLALDAKAYLLRIKGDYVSSVQLYDQALKIEPNDSDLALQKAIALYKSGQRSDAEKIFAAQRAKTKTGGSLESVCWSETIALFLDQAVEDCREAQRLAPKDDTNHLGFALLQAGKLDDALTAFEAAIARNPGTAFPYMGRAFVYARKGDSARAKADKARALALDPRIEDQFAEYGLKWDVPGAASKKTEAAARN